MTSVNLTRSGNCLSCGVPVSLHFDEGNRTLACAVAISRFRQKPLQVTDAPAQHPLRRTHRDGGAPKSLFQRSLHGLFRVV